VANGSRSTKRRGGQIRSLVGEKAPIVSAEEGLSQEEGHSWAKRIEGGKAPSLLEEEKGAPGRGGKRHPSRKSDRSVKKGGRGPYILEGKNIKGVLLKKGGKKRLWGKKKRKGALHPPSLETKQQQLRIRQREKGTSLLIS